MYVVLVHMVMVRRCCVGLVMVIVRAGVVEKLGVCE